MDRILIIDDDDAIREIVSIVLEKENYLPMVAGDAETGYEMALAHRPDLIILDLRLPGMSGLELCKKLDTAGFRKPIVVLSAIADEVDKVLLLEIGADDYMVKPFSTRELLARIRAVLRRHSSRPERTAHFGDVEIDFARRAVKRAGSEVKLTRSEYNLLVFFLQNVDRTLGRDELLSSVWGYEPYTNTRTVDAHVVRLRQKLEPDPSSPIHLLTIHGYGYRFLASPKSECRELAASVPASPQPGWRARTLTHNTLTTRTAAFSSPPPSTTPTKQATTASISGVTEPRPPTASWRC
jgi:DNA-binding response OmpR family regulator